MAQQMLKEDNLDMEGINLEMEKILQQLKKRPSVRPKLLLGR